MGSFCCIFGIGKMKLTVKWLGETFLFYFIFNPKPSHNLLTFLIHILFILPFILVNPLKMLCIRMKVFNQGFLRGVYPLLGKREDQ